MSQWTHVNAIFRVDSFRKMEDETLSEVNDK